MVAISSIETLLVSSNGILSFININLGVCTYYTNSADKIDEFFSQILPEIGDVLGCRINDGF